jgi:hypothetical protein
VATLTRTSGFAASCSAASPSVAPRELRKPAAPVPRRGDRPGPPRDRARGSRCIPTSWRATTAAMAARRPSCWCPRAGGCDGRGPDWQGRRSSCARRSFFKKGFSVWVGFGSVLLVRHDATGWSGCRRRLPRRRPRHQRGLRRSPEVSDPAANILARSPQPGIARARPRGRSDTQPFETTHYTQPRSCQRVRTERPLHPGAPPDAPDAAP